jgi:hypothetical protein
MKNDKQINTANKVKNEVRKEAATMKRALLAVGALSLFALILSVGVVYLAPAPDSARAGLGERTKQADSGALSCCAYRVKEGLFARTRRATVIIAGQVVSSKELENNTEFTVQISKKIRGENIGKTLIILGAINDPHLKSKQQSLFFLSQTAQGHLPLSVIALAERDASHAEVTASSLALLDVGRTAQTRAAAAAALCHSFINGTPSMRTLVARDLGTDNDLVQALTAVQLTALQSQITEMAGDDLALPYLIQVLGYRRDHAGSDASLIACLDKSHMSRAMPTLVRVLKTLDAEGYCSKLVSRWATASKASKVRLAHVLARLGQEAALETLNACLDNKEAPDLQAEALIAHSRSANEAGKSLAMDVIRKHLTGKTAVTPIAKILEAQQRDRMRIELPTGERHRLMAAGYFLARHKDQKIRQWLQSKLSLLDDAGVADYIKNRLDNSWASFDDPW